MEKDKCRLNSSPDYKGNDIWLYLLLLDSFDIPNARKGKKIVFNSDQKVTYTNEMIHSDIFCFMCLGY